MYPRVNPCTQISTSNYRNNSVEFKKSHKYPRASASTLNLLNLTRPPIIAPDDIPDPSLRTTRTHADQGQDDWLHYPRQRRQRRQCLSATSRRYPPFFSSSSSCYGNSADCSAPDWESTRILSASSSDPSLPSDR